MNKSKQLDMMGALMPTPAYLAGVILFSVLGYAAWRYGKRSSRPIVRWGGVVLMLYPYAIRETWLLYVVGAAICAAMYVFRDS
jgi:hypothetical protein